MQTWLRYFKRPSAFHLNKLTKGCRRQLQGCEVGTGQLQGLQGSYKLYKEYSGDNYKGYAVYNCGGRWPLVVSDCIFVFEMRYKGYERDRMGTK